VGGGGTLASPPAPHTDILALEFFRYRSCLPLYLTKLSSTYGGVFVASDFFSGLPRPGIRSSTLSIVSIIHARIIRFANYSYKITSCLLAPSAGTKSSVPTKIADCSRQQ
jgi:hypothetical protein